MQLDIHLDGYNEKPNNNKSWPGCGKPEPSNIAVRTEK